jgi:tetratricopeptide (TPR) repeat protein
VNNVERWGCTIGAVAILVSVGGFVVIPFANFDGNVFFFAVGVVMLIAAALIIFKIVPVLIKEDIEESALKKKATQGDMEAMDKLFEQYKKNNETDKAIKLLEPFAEQGDMEAVDKLLEQYKKNNRIDKGIKLLERLAEQGHSKAKDKLNETLKKAKQEAQYNSAKNQYDSAVELINERIKNYTPYTVYMSETDSEKVVNLLMQAIKGGYSNASYTLAQHTIRMFIIPSGIGDLEYPIYEKTDKQCPYIDTKTCCCTLTGNYQYRDYLRKYCLNTTDNKRECTNYKSHAK